MYTEYVAGFMFRNDATEVALVRKKKGGNFQVGKLNGIGGKIDPDDASPIMAMIREFKEETGCECDDWREFCRMVGSGWVVSFYVCLSGDYRTLKTMEEEEIAWFKVSDVFPECVSNLRWLIPMALDKDKVTATVEDYS